MTVPYWSDDRVTLYAGDCLAVLRQLPDNSVDSVVTDPPAGIFFMNREWDHHKGGRDQWIAWLAEVMREALRVTKPGGHAFVWALPRTTHWTATALEDAGWVIRERVVHLFGSGFPKSLDVGKAIDRAAGATREVVGTATGRGARPRNDMRGGAYGSTPEGLIDTSAVTAPATDAARTWDGWGTSLKPAAEDWWLARKPLTGTVAATVTAWGTGALNIDGCRVEARGRPLRVRDEKPTNRTTWNSAIDGSMVGGSRAEGTTDTGRWPPNVVLDPDTAAELDRQSGTLTSGALDRTRITAKNGDGWRFNGERSGVYEPNTGGASRFFPVFKYTAKAPTAERPRTTRGDGHVAHPTVKPLALMRWLVRLVTPPGGLVLDMFAGSGTTGEAAVLEHMRAILIEREADYLPLIVARLSKPLAVGFDFGDDAP